mmetsp:Transcript_68169/g.120592  ORF Transcript_68169/g.120592 Transcript_68169/m.120592 type:complete len:91 (+) Transcript_68169:185-457(+)
MKVRNNLWKKVDRPMAQVQHQAGEAEGGSARRVQSVSTAGQTLTLSPSAHILSFAASAAVIPILHRCATSRSRGAPPSAAATTVAAGTTG